MISVIIPAFNAEAYLSEALESLKNQTYQDFETIVIDDGSTDNTANIIRHFPDINYHYQKNQGESAARNKGMELASGQFLAFLDADDWYEPTKLEKQVSFLQQHSMVDVVYCDFRTYNERNGKYSTFTAEPFQDSRVNFLATVLFRQILPNLACCMLRRECYDAGCRFKPGLRYAPDYDFCLQLLEQFNFGYINQPLYGYRRHSGNVTNNHERQKESEINTVRSLGLERIKAIVEESTYSAEAKNLLLARIMLKIGEYKNCLMLLSAKQVSFLQFFYAGNCHYLMGEIDACLSYFQSALEIQPNFPEALNNLGCALAKSNNIEDARKNFTRAMKLRPGYMDAAINLKGNKPPKLTIFELRKTLTLYNLVDHLER